MKPADFLPKKNIETLIKSHSYAYVFLKNKFDKLTSISKKIKNLRKKSYETSEEIYSLIKKDLIKEINDLWKLQEVIKDIEAIILKEKLNDLSSAKQQYCKIFLLENDFYDNNSQRKANKALTKILTGIEDLKKILKEIIILGYNHDN